MSAVRVAQADAVEHSLVAALPLGPQSAAGGVSLPKTFHGELQVGSAPGHSVLMHVNDSLRRQSRLSNRSSQGVFPRSGHNAPACFQLCFAGLAPALL